MFPSVPPDVTRTDGQQQPSASVSVAVTSWEVSGAEAPGSGFLQHIRSLLPASGKGQFAKECVPLLGSLDYLG